MKTKEQDFLLLINQHKGILHKVSRMYMDNEEDRNDLIQEIVLQLWKSYEKFEGKSQFSTWMYRVSLNIALTYFKKEKKNTERHTLLDNFDKIEEDYSNEKEQQLTLFYQAVHELNKVEKALIFLFLEGLSHREIAQNLGISEVNARVKLNRTKEKLQNLIKSYGYEFG